MERLTRHKSIEVRLSCTRCTDIIYRLSQHPSNKNLRKASEYLKEIQQSFNKSAPLTQAKLKEIRTLLAYARRIASRLQNYFRLNKTLIAEFNQIIKTISQLCDDVEN